MEEKIKAYMTEHRNQLVEDVKTLVRIRSDKGEAMPGEPYGSGPAAALEKMMELARSRGFAGKIYDERVGAIDLGPAEPGLDMLTHLDVVPVADNWTVCPPFEPVEREGRLYGRGTADDKGPAVAALWAMQCVRELGCKPCRRVRLLVGTDEECGSSDIAAYYSHEPEAPMTFSPDADFPLINIEKGGLHGTVTASYPAPARPAVVSLHSGFKINVVPDTADAVLAGISASEVQPACDAFAAQTGLRFDLREQDGGLQIHCVGTGAHAAHPQDGNNALTGLLALLTRLPLAQSEGFSMLCALSGLLPHGDFSGRALGVAMEDEISGALTLSLDLMELNEAGFTAQFDSRCPICASEENMQNVCIRAFAEAGLSMEDVPMNPPHHVPGNSPFVRTLLGCYERYTGAKNSRPLAIGGGTYCHGLKNGVAFGCTMPGTDNRMHGADEFAVIDELVVSAEIFAQAIIELCCEVN